MTDIEKMERDSTYQGKSEVLLDMECRRMKQEYEQAKSVLTYRTFRDWAEEHGWGGMRDKKLIDYIAYKYSLPR